MEPAVPAEILEAVAGLPAVVPAARAAEFLNVDVRTIRRWARTGKVRVLRTDREGSGKVNILRSEIARVLAGMMQPVAFEPRS